jgi:hypothetical protein
MTAQQVAEIITSLPTGFTARTESAALAKIEAAAEKIAPMLAAKGLQISKGGSSPTTQKSYARIYLERIGNTSHDSRHTEYQENVIATWEWQTKSKYGYSPISAAKIKAFCDSLVSEVEAA